MAWKHDEPKNLSVTVENGQVVVRFDPDIRCGPSATGKTMIVSKGTCDVPGFPGMSFSLTAYTKDKSV